MSKTSTSFLHNFLTLCEGSEIPPRFALWCGISTLGAALGRRVYLDKGTYTLFPNFCIVLIASSGQFRKTTSINAAKSILELSEININRISQKITAEALFKSMAESSKQIGWSEGYVVASELRNFINPRAIEGHLDTVLCEMLDCDKEISYDTIGRGKLTVSNACLNVLAASTAESARSALTEQAIKGGLASRMLFVYESRLPPGVYMQKLTDEKQVLKDSLADYLTGIGFLEGEYSMTPEAFEWGRVNYLKNREGHPFSKDDLLGGYASRRHDHIARLAIILSASEDTSRKIEVRHMKGAEDMLFDLEEFLPMVMRLVTSSVSGTVIQQILETVRSKRDRQISYPDLAQIYSHKVGFATFQDAILMLQMSNQLTLTDNGSVRIVKAS